MPCLLQRLRGGKPGRHRERFDKSALAVLPALRTYGARRTISGQAQLWCVMRRPHCCQVPIVMNLCRVAVMLMQCRPRDFIASGRAHYARSRVCLYGSAIALTCFSPSTSATGSDFLIKRDHTRIAATTTARGLNKHGSLIQNAAHFFASTFERTLCEAPFASIR